MRTLLITGGTGGLGTVVVERLRRNYECVLLRRGDFASDDALRAAIARAERPYGLVHMAGGYAGGRASETTRETWSNMMAMNVDTAFAAIRETLARMNRD